MPDPVERLRDFDPAALLPDADAPPPAAVLARIVASPPEARRSRAPRLVAAVAGLAVAAVAAVAVLAPSGGGVSLAERAYAATAPADAVVFTETMTTETHDGVVYSTNHVRTWQHADRMHDVMDLVQDGKPFRYEHDQNGAVFRTLYRGKVDAVRRDDPGWRNGEGEKGFAQNLQTVVEQFRARFPRLKDAGETAFNGRPAHAYKDGNTTYYIDRKTALPLGNVLVDSYFKSGYLDKATHKIVGTGTPVQMRVTTTIDRYQRLPVTPENLALLDAPAIAAAQR
jgi:hypothetical protein